jgi:hypothetical protein
VDHINIAKFELDLSGSGSTSVKYFCGNGNDPPYSVKSGDIFDV